METIFKYIKLPFSFDANAMLAEVSGLTEVWLPHYNTNDYSGEWKAIPLRSVNGSLVNALPQLSANAEFLDTVLLQQCPAIKRTVDSLLCNKTAIRLLSLKPGTVVKEHSDPGLCYEDGEIRLHVPLVTNSAVEFYIDGENVQPLPGECWYMNFNLKHSLANYGETDRIHLVIDCIVNDWVHELFASCDNIVRIPSPGKFTGNDQRLIIEQLRTIGTETALAMAKEMEDKLTGSI